MIWEREREREPAANPNTSNCNLILRYQEARPGTYSQSPCSSTNHIHSSASEKLEALFHLFGAFGSVISCTTSLQRHNFDMDHATLTGSRTCRHTRAKCKLKTEKNLPFHAIHCMVNQERPVRMETEIRELAQDRCWLGI